MDDPATVTGPVPRRMLECKAAWLGLPRNPDRTHALVAEDKADSVGWIYQLEVAEGSAWLRATNAITAAAGTVGCVLSSYAPTKQEAADRAMTAWGMLVEVNLSGHGLQGIVVCCDHERRHLC